MSDQAPEFNKLQGSDDRNIDLSEHKSIQGSAQSIAQEPSEEYVAPTMALDSLQSDSDD